MEKRTQVKSRRKMISPVFHTQTKNEDEKHLSKEMIKTVRRTGILKLCGKHLATVPEKLFTIYDQVDENVVNLDFNRQDKEEELWWNVKPLIHLDLSSNVLTAIPSKIGIFQDLTVVNLQDNSLTILPAELMTLTKLTKLLLSHNKINTLPNDIDKLIELRVLNISHNMLQQLPGSLVDLVMLEKLDLSNNLIESLPSGIGYLVRITDLIASNNKIKTLPPDIVNLRSLMKLDLNNNNIKELPESLGELRKLQLLYAQHNDIGKIPDFTGCECLLEVYFGNNFIKEIPVDFHENLLQLKILDLRDNQIEVIPPEIAKMVHLTQLDFTNNELAEVPAALGLLPHLQSLKLEGNKLKQIRGDIIHTGTQRILQHLRERLKEEDVSLVIDITGAPSDVCVFPDRYKMKNGNILNLTMRNLSEVPENVFNEACEARVAVVDLCKNKLSTVPEGLQKLSDYLTELNLSVNHLKVVPDFVAKFTKLKFLDLSNNSLSDLPDSLSDMVSLRELVLFNNRFIKIPQCIYGMAGIEILMLNDNKLDEIDIEQLLKLTRITTLNLTNNNINFVPPQLGNMTHIKSLELKGNSFRQPRYAILEQGTESILSYLRDKIPR
ncbi:leucine-rich repeat-containing protein 40-like isoform X1 [Rhynchophorus ferrugineus]|uniref:leucine-rich repeat-containing protein 40-like isoform X1 n=1 Tax=Rhynchophorus ferrugineus TaxID=354439 RepID=UPI003FCE4BC1